MNSNGRFSADVWLGSFFPPVTIVHLPYSFRHRREPEFHQQHWDFSPSLVEGEIMSFSWHAGRVFILGCISCVAFTWLPSLATLGQERTVDETALYSQVAGFYTALTMRDLPA